MAIALPDTSQTRLPTCSSNLILRNPLDERETTRDIAKAYRQNEIGEKQPEFQRIVQNVEKQLVSAGNPKKGR